LEGRFDVLVVGSGPAGSAAALVLARGGARVALVDKARFPRDKACGDLIGPRAVQHLDDLGIELPGAERVGDMIVLGPSGRRVRLPCRPGLTYPGYGLAAPRVLFDQTLREAAVSAGAESFVGRAGEPLLRGDGTLEGFMLSSGTHLAADVVIGADGATSRVAEVAGLVDPTRVLWGFAVRAYVDDPVSMPHIVLWEPSAWRGFPGYGWLFPGVGGRANIGLGVGVLSDRSAGGAATQRLDDFMEHLSRLGVLQAPPPPASPGGRLGGWLKMGMVGTTPARGRVFLAGDAAGLVNPLQGEGISQALGSGRAAAEAVLAGPGDAAGRYRRMLATTYGPYQSITAPVHGALLTRPRAVAAIGRLVTAPGVGRAVAGGWSIFWNDLLEGAAPGPPRRVAAAAAGVGRTLTARSRTREWFGRTDPPEPFRRSSATTVVAQERRNPAN
jgi:geranylgeranyl reductase family protein